MYIYLIILFLLLDKFCMMQVLEGICSFMHISILDNHAFPVSTSHHEIIESLRLNNNSAFVFLRADSHKGMAAHGIFLGGSCISQWVILEDP